MLDGESHLAMRTVFTFSFTMWSGSSWRSGMGYQYAIQIQTSSSKVEAWRDCWCSAAQPAACCRCTALSCERLDGSRWILEARPCLVDPEDVGPFLWKPPSLCGLFIHVLLILLFLYQSSLEAASLSARSLGRHWNCCRSRSSGYFSGSVRASFV